MDTLDRQLWNQWASEDSILQFPQNWIQSNNVKRIVAKQCSKIDRTVTKPIFPQTIPKDLIYELQILVFAMMNTQFPKIWENLIDEFKQKMNR